MRELDVADVVLLSAIERDPVPVVSPCQPAVVANEFSNKYWSVRADSRGVKALLVVGCPLLV